MGEIGEAIGIIKKHRDTAAVRDAAVRKDLVEEMAGVLVFCHGVMLCYGISAGELKQACTAKFEKDMTRW